MLLYFVHRRRIDQGPGSHSLVQSVARHQRCDGRRQLARKRVIHRVVYVEAIGADTGLAVVAELGHQGALHGGVQIGVVENDEGRVATQLQRNLLDVRRALRQ